MVITLGVFNALDFDLSLEQEKISTVRITEDVYRKKFSKFMKFL